MDLGLDGRRILIVGGSDGIGRASAIQFAEDGAQVAIASRSTENLDKAADLVERAAGRRPDTVVADLTEPGAGAVLADAVMQRWGALDGLVTAVGGSIRSDFAALTDEDWLANYTFNVLSTVRAVRALLGALERGDRPSVVTLGAAASKMPYAHQIVSNVHKAGLLGLTKTLAGELAGRGIRVNCVAPGRTLTSLWTNRAAGMAAERGVSEAAVLEEFSRDIPLGRFGEPEEVAVMVVWLSSPRAGYVTGQAVNVDGGIARGLL